jgi:hypothetical protein
MTQHIEEARKTYRNGCNYPPETPVADGTLILAIAAALAAAEERGRSEERERMSEDQKNPTQLEVKKDWHWEDVGGGWIKKVYEDELVKVDECIRGKSDEFDSALKTLSSLDAPYEKEAVSLLVKVGAQLSRPHLGMVLVYFGIMRGIGRREVEREVEADTVRYANLLKCSQEVIRCKRDPYLNLVQAMRDLEDAITKEPIP